jgi:hypothetical protein
LWQERDPTISHLSSSLLRATSLITCVHVLLLLLLLLL